MLAFFKIFKYSKTYIIKANLSINPNLKLISWNHKKFKFRFSKNSFRKDLKNGNWVLSYKNSIMFNPGLYF